MAADGKQVVINPDGTNILSALDIQIGQVELKDSDTTAQANIKAANTARTASTVVLATQLIDAAGVVNGVTQNTLISGEDQTNDVLKTENQFSYSVLAADGQIKGAAGFVHTMTFTSDAAATAGSIILYDSLTEAGTAVFTYTVPAAYVSPFTITLDVKMTTGIYLGFTTTADVIVTTSFR